MCTPRIRVLAFRRLVTVPSPYQGEGVCSPRIRVLAFRRLVTVPSPYQGEGVCTPRIRVLAFRRLVTVPSPYQGEGVCTPRIRVLAFRRLVTVPSPPGERARVRGQSPQPHFPHHFVIPIAIYLSPPSNLRQMAYFLPAIRPPT